LTPRDFPRRVRDRRAHTRLAMAVLMFLAIAAALSPLADSRSNGAFDAQGRGCYCHGDTPSPNVGFTVNGLPGHYVPGANYTIEINVTLSDVRAVANKSQGGFYLEATAGSLSVPPTMNGLIQISGNASTHTRDGARYRHWQVNWTAPPQDGLVVTFSVYVNTVNGDGSETFNNDHWTSRTVRIGVGPEPEISGPPPIQPPMAMETYGLLAVAVAAGAVALYMFLQARRGPPTTPQNDEKPLDERRK
jgi:hypothetical protein